MAAPVLNFLNVDALVPLAGAGDLKEGFTRVPLTLSPSFSPDVTSYEALAPLAATAFSIGATSFAKAGVRLNDAPGSLRQIPATGSELVCALTATLHSMPDGAELRRYTVTVTRSEKASGAGETVKIDTSVAVPAPAPAAHAHSHGGVPCTADHGHGHAAEAPKHGHSHDGGKTACTADHGHAHAAAEEPKHGHAHAEHGHAHAEEPKHGHSHAPVAEEHGHSHGGKPCGHSHGEHGYVAADGEWSSFSTPDGKAHRFSQDGDSVSVEVEVPAGTKGGDLKVLITGSGVECGLVGGPGGGLLCGLLAGNVCKADSSWSLVSEKDGRRVLCLNLAKAEEGKRWPTLLK